MTFAAFSDILNPVSERKNNEMKNEKRFLNVKFNVKRNPEYKGNHELAGCNGVLTTFPLNTTEADMIKEFHAEIVGKDIDGKTWTKGEIVQVVSIENCFEDRHN